jgi:hypothetical protein
MKFTLTITCDNAAFGESERELANELAECLSRVQHKLEDGDPPMPGESITISDFNGNNVGMAMLTN